MRNGAAARGGHVEEDVVDGQVHVALFDENDAVAAVVFAPNVVSLFDKNRLHERHHFDFEVDVSRAEEGALEHDFAVHLSEKVVFEFEGQVLDHVASALVPAVRNLVRHVFEEFLDFLA